MLILKCQLQHVQLEIPTERLEEAPRNQQDLQNIR